MLVPLPTTTHVVDVMEAVLIIVMMAPATLIMLVPIDHLRAVPVAREDTITAQHWHKWIFSSFSHFWLREHSSWMPSEK